MSCAKLCVTDDSDRDEKESGDRRQIADDKSVTGTGSRGLRGCIKCSGMRNKEESGKGKEKREGQGELQYKIDKCVEGLHGR